MGKWKIILKLIFLSIVISFIGYLITQQIEDNKKLDPKTNDTEEMNEYYKLILIPFNIPALATIMIILYEILHGLRIINEWEWLENVFE